VQDGEEVIFAHKVKRRDCCFKTTWVNFAITNQRIALVPYKQGIAQADINYADLFNARMGTEGAAKTNTQFHLTLNEKTKLLGFIPARKKITFQLFGTAGEAFKLLAKDAASDYKAMVNDLADASAVVDKQASILSHTQMGTSAATIEREKRELWQLRSQQLHNMVSAAQTKEAKSKKPTPVDRAKLLVSLVNEAIKTAKA
jgi:hypothetical protein